MTTQERQQLKRLIDEATRRKISEPSWGVCLHCEKEFTPICATQKFCDRNCRQAHWQDKRYWLDPKYRERRIEQRRQWRRERAA